jgi:formamidopyrimidine-DNA glycosylase
MPELPEVEQFRRMLLPLATPFREYQDGDSNPGKPSERREQAQRKAPDKFVLPDVDLSRHAIRISLPTLDSDQTLPRKWITPDDIKLLHDECDLQQPVSSDPDEGKVEGSATSNRKLSRKDYANGQGTTKHCYCLDVLRHGKQLSMTLMVVDTSCAKSSPNIKRQRLSRGPRTSVDNTNQRAIHEPTILFYSLLVHMGMTGQIVTPTSEIAWGSKSPVKSEPSRFPPKYTYLSFQNGTGYQAALSDTRKFGSTQLVPLSFEWRSETNPAGRGIGSVLDPVSLHLCIDSDLFRAVAALARQASFSELAPDAWLCSPEAFEGHCLPKLVGSTTGIKALLLDQKRAFSGIGNWIADEVLYQCGMHPEQCFLLEDEARHIFETLQGVILPKAVECLSRDEPYPSDWLFSYRWTKSKTATRTQVDSFGRTISFLTAGGRTSAIVSSIQKLKSRNKKRELESPHLI